MTGKAIIALTALAGVGAFFAWKLTARGAYESAEYTVVVSDGPLEVREYPDLMLAATGMQLDSQGSDGSFMRLFRYISGANHQERKIAMTTPVFMEAGDARSQGEMGFVLPREIAGQEIPAPTNRNVQIRRRQGGRYAVIRFAGRINTESLAKAEKQLRSWMERKELAAVGDPEYAGYDPPWTPGPLRRNEVLLRLE